ncbi:MAG: hypothetical protein IJ764_02710 [Bacteroidales bacterium]|nr:hypothetical protein [Bacteroidales bacterium]
MPTNVSPSEDVASLPDAGEQDTEDRVASNENPSEASPSAQNSPNAKASTSEPSASKDVSNDPTTTSNRPSSTDGSNTARESVKPTSSAATALSSSLDENALRVVRGDFGNGQERKDALGSRYDEIQTRVNEMYREGRFN